MPKNSRSFDPAQGLFSLDGRFVLHLEDSVDHPPDPRLMPFSEDDSPQETDVNREQRKLIHLAHSVNHAFIVQKLIRANHDEELPGTFTALVAADATNTPTNTIRRVLMNTKFYVKVAERRIGDDKKPSVIYAVRPWRDILADLLPLVRVHHYQKIRSHYPPDRWMNKLMWTAMEYSFRKAMQEFWYAINSPDHIKLTLLNKPAYLKHFITRESAGEPVYVWQMLMRTGMTYDQFQRAMKLAKLMWTKDSTKREITVFALGEPDRTGERQQLPLKAIKAEARQIAQERRPDLKRHYLKPTAFADGKQTFLLAVPRFIVPQE